MQRVPNVPTDRPLLFRSVAAEGDRRVSEQKTYVYQNRLIDMSTFGNMTDDEEQIISEHFMYLKDALKRGQLILAGPCVNGEFGLVIYRAESMEKAQRFMEGDPAIAQGLMAAELHEFRMSLLEGRD
jgi:uncharacterized protein